MKIVAINGSARKNFSCSLMLSAFVDGVKETDPDTEVKVINIYDYDFKGCRGCLQCKRVGNPDCCAIKDNVHELLKEVRECDGIVFASPIYYFDISGQLRCFFERLMYPGPVEKTIPVTSIYAMNATEEHMNKTFLNHIDDLEMFIKSCFHGEMNRCYVFDSLARKGDDSLYKPSRSNHAGKRKRHEEVFPAKMKEAYNLGVKMIKEN